MKKEGMSSKMKTTIILAAAGALLIGVGILMGDSGVLGNLIIIAAIMNIFPYFIYKYTDMMWLKNAEVHFPTFIRDLGDSVRTGMSLAEAITVVSKSNYGKLSEEVIRMNNRLSWGTPFIRTVEIFEKKTKGSRIMTEAMKIIKESYESGGDIVSTLDSVSNNILMMKEADAERTSLLKQQIFIMYGIYAIFLGVCVMIINIMVPMIQSQPDVMTAGSTFMMFTDPCEVDTVFVCVIFDLVNVFIGVPTTGIGSYYVALFFTAVIIQGFFIGLIVGQIGENSIIAGFKHSIIMVFAGVGTFLFLAKMGMFVI
jgi:flagellar protein FlaJ